MVMTRTSVDLSRVPGINLNYFMFDLKDDNTLRSIDAMLSNAYPGVAKVIRWTDPDETEFSRAFNVILEFPDEYKMMEWLMRWS